MSHQPLSVYRLTLDENGVEGCRDFISPNDAHDEFDAANKRRAVFSARLEFVASNGAHKTIAHFERT